MFFCAVSGGALLAVQFISTRHNSPPVSFGTALFEGLAPDGGLYVPDALPAFAMRDLTGASLAELGAEIAARFVGGELPRSALDRLIASALNFPVPLVSLDGDISVLELFHGPTFAFKDVGARVMARLMAALNAADRPLTILVATSGDTGSAVAQAFSGLSGTRVVVLFPLGGVTPVQEAQFATIGGNVQAIGVVGTFDDCQRLVKEAFADPGIRREGPLTSANSINIGRLLPQIFYYVHAALALDRADVAISVPSGNFGNLTAGVMACRLGAPIRQFVAATTVNDTFPRYLATGRYEPAPSVATLANAMDVGRPSNVERLRWLFDDDRDWMRELIVASVQTDEDVRRGIRVMWDRYGYVSDPHTSIGFLGLDAVAQSEHRGLVCLATAHPAKFREAVEPVLGREVPLPPPLADALTRPRLVERIAPTLDALRPFVGTS
jgi:threonine synthase